MRNAFKLSKGFFWFALRNWTRALAAFETVPKGALLWPIACQKSIQLHLLLGHHLEAISLWRESRKLLEEAGALRGPPPRQEKVGPQDPSDFAAEGYGAFSLGNYETAAKSLEKAVRRVPGDDLALYMLGLSYARMGNPKKARKQWRRLKALESRRAGQLHASIEQIE